MQKIFFFSLPFPPFFFSLLPFPTLETRSYTACLITYLSLLFLFHIAKAEESQKLFLKVQNQE